MTDNERSAEIIARLKERAKNCAAAAGDYKPESQIFCLVAHLVAFARDFNDAATFIADLTQELERYRKPSGTPAEIEKRLAEIRQRCEDASPGPWTKDGGAVYSAIGCGTDCKRSLYDHFIFADPDTKIVDLRFIANARADIPFLLQENARLTAFKDAVRELCDEADDLHTAETGQVGLVRTRDLRALLAAHDKGGTAE